jgi:SAM-dependent MidA family methyltransferase
MRVGYERVRHDPPPADDPGEPALIARLRDEIDAHGPITFARFMERALYEPGLGYYATSATRPTRTGDFLTAPELHPLFGWTVARQIDEMWQRLGRPQTFTLREFGAGTGTLGQAIEDGLRRAGSHLADCLSYEPIETESRTVAPATRNGRMVGCVLANEFVDALPVHRVVMRGRRLHELFVGWSEGRFVEVVGQLSDPRLAARFQISGVRLADGQRAEVNLAMTAWLNDVRSDLEAGYVLIFDYAAPATELFAPGRLTGTLRAFRGQHVSSDVLAGVGRQDITSTVDLDALEAGAIDAGLTALGRARQAEFLMGCGLEDAYTSARAGISDDWDAAVLLRSAVTRLLDPRALGGYWVDILGSNVPRDPPLRGLAYRLARRPQ